MVEAPLGAASSLVVEALVVEASLAEASLALVESEDLMKMREFPPRHLLRQGARSVGTMCCVISVEHSLGRLVLLASIAEPLQT